MKPDEFNGLIGNIAGNLIKDNAGQIIGGLFGGGSKGKLRTYLLRNQEIVQKLSFHIYKCYL